MIQLAALPLALALSAAAPAQEAPAVEQASVQTVQDEGGSAAATVEEPGFFAKYLPFGFNEGLEPETEENFVLLYISGILGPAFAAGIWLPMVTAGNPADWLMDSIISTIVHWVIWFPCVPIQAAISQLYLNPVATVNLWDYNLKKAKKAGTWKAATNTVRPPSEQELAFAQPSMAF